MNFSWRTKKKLSSPLFAGKKKNPGFWMNEWPMNFYREKKTVTFSWWIKLSEKKPLVFYGRFLVCYWHESETATGSFVMSRAKFHKLSRPLFVFHGHFLSYFVTGNTSVFTGKIRGFLARALFRSHGHFFKKCHGQTENCHVEKKNTDVNSSW